MNLALKKKKIYFVTKHKMFLLISEFLGVKTVIFGWSEKKYAILHRTIFIFV